MQFEPKLIENEKTKISANVAIACIPALLGVGFIAPCVAVFIGSFPNSYVMEDWKLLVLQAGCFGGAVLLYGIAMKTLDGLKP